MADAGVFPAFIRAEFDGRNAFAEFINQGRSATDTVERQFRASGAELQRIITSALTRPATAAGGLDLGVGEMRAATQAAEQRALALREVANAATALVAREGQLTVAQQAHIAATLAEANAAERDLVTKREQLAIHERLQAELDQSASAHQRLAAVGVSTARASSAVAATVGQQRAAYQQLGFQVQDVTQQMALGINPLVILAQQGGQTAFALSQFGGTLGRVASFMSGPWGAAILGGVTILGFLASRSEEATQAQTDLAGAADTLGRAQGLLGQFIDLATGKQSQQNEVLREAIRLTAVLAQLEAQRAGREAGLRLARLRPDAFLDERGRAVGRAEEARFRGLLGEESGAPSATGLRANPGVQAFERLVRDFRSNGNASIAAFRRELEAMASRGELAGLDVNSALREAITIATNRNEFAAMRDVQRVAEGGQVPGYLLRPRAGGGRAGGSGRHAPDQTEFGEDAGRRIADISARFTEVPAQVEAVRRAMADLDDVASDLERRRPPNYDNLVKQLAEARETVADGILAPYREWLDSDRERAEIQQLINAGRTVEAEALQTIAQLEERVGKLSESQRETIAERIQLRAEEARQAELAQQLQQRYLSAIQDTRAGLEQTIANLNRTGLRGVGEFASGLYRQYRGLSAQHLVEQLFGDTFRQLEDQVTGRGRVREANETQAEAADTAAAALDRLTEAVEKAAEGVTKTVAGRKSGEPANDDDPIVVTGTRKKVPTEEAPAWADLDPRTFMQAQLSALLGRVLGGEEGAAKIGKQISAAVTDAMEGAAFGQFAAASVLGQSSTASAVGGAIGNIAGKELGGVLDSVFKGLGQFAGPLGSIVGGLAGSLVGGLFTSTPRASTTIVGADGRLQVASTTGTRSLRGQTATAADSVISTVERIAELFGGSVISGAGAVSIGIRNGSYRLDPTGQGRTRTSRGAIDFGEDAEAAVRAAVLDLIQDGVIAGLREGTQRLLQSAKDLDAGIQRALDFESVFTDLKAHLDPTGAAIDALNKKFERLKTIFAEAGASAEEYAQLEQLYGIERKEALEGALGGTDALRQLLDDLTIGNPALSLSERLAAARAKFDPLASDIAAGKVVNYDDFSAAARALLDVQRQISGSGAGYFELVDYIKNITGSALSRQQGLADAATGLPSPFSPPTPSTSQAPTVSAIDRLGSVLVQQLGGRLDALNDNMGTLVRQNQRMAAGAGAARFADFSTDRSNF